MSGRIHFCILTIWRSSIVVSGSHAKGLDFEEVVGLKRAIKAFSSIATWLARLLIPFVLNGVDIIFDYTIPDVSVTWSEAQPTRRKELLSWLGWIAITFFSPFLPQFNNKRVGYFFPPHYLSEEPNLNEFFIIFISSIFSQVRHTLRPKIFIHHAKRDSKKMHFYRKNF